MPSAAASAGVRASAVRRRARSRARSVTGPRRATPSVEYANRMSRSPRSSSRSSTTEEKRLSPTRCGSATSFDERRAAPRRRCRVVVVMRTTVSSHVVTSGRPLCHECVKCTERRFARPFREDHSEPMTHRHRSQPPPRRCSSPSRCAAFAFARPSAHAATGVRYGLTDDAWLQSGSGSLNSRLARLHDARRPGRSLHAQLEPRSQPSNRQRRATRRTLRTTGAMSTPCWTDFGRKGSPSSCSSTEHHVGPTVAGARTTRRHRARASREFAAAAATRYLVGHALAGLERAEPGALAATDDGRGVHDRGC